MGGSINVTMMGLDIGGKVQVVHHNHSVLSIRNQFEIPYGAHIIILMPQNGNSLVDDGSKKAMEEDANVFFIIFEMFWPIIKLMIIMKETNSYSITLD